MRKRTVCFSLVILCLLLFSFTLAWYRNNRQTQVIQTDSISVKGNGVLRTAFATDEDGILQSAEGADYRGELNLRIGDAFENVSGNGLVLYEASLNSNGEPIEEEWKLATADVASQTGDSGQYVTADLYFKSDVPMDIYLLSTSSVAPVTESGGSDLCNNQGYESYTTYSNFGAGGVPVQNINQSSFGLFSRNLIAGATRVAFSEYGYSNEDWTEPDLPNLVWVPNSTFKLTPATDSRVLYRMDISDTPANRESNYTFYSRLNDVGILYTVPRADGVVSGELYVKKNATSSWESVQETVISHTQLVACRQPSGADKPIPQIWVNTANVDAAYCEALDCHVYAQYDGTYGLEKGYALIGKLNNTTVYVRPNEEGTGYVKLQMGSDSRWQTTDVQYTTEAEVTALTESFVKTTAEYQVTHWTEGDNLQITDDKFQVIPYKVATTSVEKGANLYTRIRVNIWVEGYDREANIALNSGKFDINLIFYGSVAEQE